VTRPRRILFVHQFLGSFGGAERYLELLLPALRERGVEPAVVLFGTRTLHATGLLSRVEAFAPIRTEPGATTPWGVRRALRGAEPDLLHWNMPEPFLYRGGLLASLPWGVPSVLTDHLPMMRDGLHYELVRRLVNRRLSGIILVSESAEAEARSHWRHLPPLAVVRNGVKVAGAGLRTPPEDEPLRLLFVGRLERQKGPAAGLAALAALRDRGVPARLRFVGAGSLAPSLEREAAELGLLDAVDFVGFVADPAPQLLDAHVLLAPGEFEGLPLAPMEALASGLPVLASDIPPHRELARECAALRVVPVGASGDAWAAEVERMLPGLESLSETAMTAGELFSVDRMADGTVAAYERFFRPR
jgi:glycosyltransferase involved in cell wall biosynthesis